MEKEVFETTVIALLTDILMALKKMENGRRPLVYGKNPSLIDVVDHCVDMLKGKPMGLTIRELYEGLQEKGVTFTSVNPENYLGTMLWRAVRATNPVLARSGYRYVLYTKIRIKGQPDLTKKAL